MQKNQGIIPAKILKGRLRMASEKSFENKIKTFLKDNGCWFIKYWGGSTFTRAGIPDILANCNGYFLAVEVKAANGKPSELQLHNIKTINNSNGFGIILYPNQWEEFKRLIKSLQQSNRIAAREYTNKINKRWWSY